MKEKQRTRKGKAPRPRYLRTPGKVVSIVVVLALVALLAGGFLIYYYVYPRVDLEIKTLYHERIGGGSTGGGINVNIQLTNKGTVDIEGLGITVNIINETDSLMKSESLSMGDIEPHDVQEAAMDFIGNHLETYYITISVKFSSNGEAFAKDYSYKTYEESMNIVFVSDVKD
jgi:hypothetical protein